jgi:uncharacterized protein (TIGR02118 family)
MPDKKIRRKAMPKIVVIYPYPKDVEEFEKAYTEDHIPLATKITGVSKFIASRVIGTPDGGQPPFYRIAELHFPSMEDLQTSAASARTQEAVSHAVAISSGGAPIFLVAEEDAI